MAQEERFGLSLTVLETVVLPVTLLLHGRNNRIRTDALTVPNGARYQASLYSELASFRGSSLKRLSNQKLRNLRESNSSANTRFQADSIWRRNRDSNSGVASGLTVFETVPFNRLGIPPYEPNTGIEPVILDDVTGIRGDQSRYQSPSYSCSDHLNYVRQIG